MKTKFKSVNLHVRISPIAALNLKSLSQLYMLSQSDLITKLLSEEVYRYNNKTIDKLYFSSKD